MSRVYIGRLADSARDRDVERFFKGYGRIREILLKNGYGFVEFEDHRDADDAVYDLNGKVLCGERVIVEHAKSPGSRTAAQFERRGGNSDRFGPPLRTPYRVVVENISSRTTWQDLKDYLGKVGEVTFVEAHKDRSGEGVAEFSTLGDMKNAVTKLNGTDLQGRRIKLREDRGGASNRRASGPRRRSRSRSRSRDRRSRSPRRRVSRSKSRSRSPRRQDSKRRSRSRSPVRRSRSRSPVRRSRTRSPPRRSRSHSPQRQSRSASRDGFNSRSPQRQQSRSASRSPRSSASLSPSPHRNGRSSNQSHSRSRS